MARYYRCYFVDRARTIRFVKEFVCTDAAEAIQLARRTFNDRASYYYSAIDTWRRFEVWNGKRRIHVEERGDGEARSDSPSASSYIES